MPIERRKPRMVLVHPEPFESPPQMFRRVSLELCNSSCPIGGEQMEFSRRCRSALGYGDFVFRSPRGFVACEFGLVERAAQIEKGGRQT
jgi:hypothetical protein